MDAPTSQELIGKPDPQDICPVSRDSDQPTAYQYVAGLLGFDLIRRVQLVNNSFFSQGWDAGFERDLGQASFPETNTDDQLAFSFGVLTGMYAEVQQLHDPFCLVDDDTHSERCGNYVQHLDGRWLPYSDADTHRDGAVAGLVPDLDIDMPTLAKKVGKRTITLDNSTATFTPTVTPERLAEVEKLRYPGSRPEPGPRLPA